MGKREPAGEYTPTEAELRILSLSESERVEFGQAIARDLARKGARNAFRRMSHDDKKAIGFTPVPEGWR